MADAGGINPIFEQRLNALVAASNGRVTVSNAYRSTARQKQLWEAALRKYGSAAAARKWVAPPGNSKHQQGIAADLKGDLKWAHANAARFGIWFPLSNEAWHAELIGSRGKNGTPTVERAHDHAEAPGNPDALDELAGIKPEWGTIEGQLANLMAAITTPTERVF